MLRVKTLCPRKQLFSWRGSYITTDKSQNHLKSVLVRCRLSLYNQRSSRVFTHACPYRGKSRIKFQGRQLKGIPSFYIMSLGGFAHCRHMQSGNGLMGQCQ